MNQDKLEVLITSGGTISEIDNVRHIGNFSSGTTGSKIGEEFLMAGAKVHYLYAGNSKIPFKRSLCLRTDIPFEREEKRVKEAFDNYQKYKSGLHEYGVRTFEEYSSVLESVLKANPIDVVILAAAVSDYSAEKTPGKISSDKENLLIKLKKNPKVISLVKTWNPRVYQVGFKLLIDVSDEELKTTAYSHLVANNSDLVVANSLNSANEVKSARTFLINRENSAREVKRGDLPKILLETVLQSIKK